MEKIFDYEIIDRLAETPYAIRYKARKEASLLRPQKKSVIIEVLKLNNFSKSDIPILKQTYAKIRSMDTSGILKIIDIKAYQGNMAVFYEGFSRDSLRTVYGSQKIALHTFLKIAIALSRTLGNLHKKHIVHKNLRPHNILYHKQLKEVKLVSFGASSLIYQEFGNISEPTIIRDTLAYISPEQTGRMNRAVDYRTDLYTLGIIFYEILTGNVPFISNDPLTVIHSHIAVTPVPPVEIVPQLPSIVSDIVMKLLAKSAEDRYQNSFGLMADLQYCQEQLNRHSTIEAFVLGQKDISTRFLVPKLFIGREKETEMFVSAFDRAVQGGCEVILFSGDPGVGKSTLINEIKKLLIKKRGYYLSGKYEQFQQDVPYSAIIAAFQKLIRQLLSESKERVAVWKKELRSALGINGKIIIDVIPDLAFIIGDQPEVTDLDPEESQNRFNIVFQNFTSVFAKPEHPLVIFLDDLQWIDHASLQLASHLITYANFRNILFIGTYRENEISQAYPLTNIFSKSNETHIRINRLRIEPFTIGQVTDYITAALKSEKKTVTPLAELVFKKTHGNPFFINQFLKTLHDADHLHLDTKDGWQWDLHSLHLVQATDNVIELLIRKITQLDAGTQEVLKISACIGNRFDLETLAGICETASDTTLENLMKAVSEELIGSHVDYFIFLHNRIRETAYSLLSEQEKKKFHFKIGKLIRGKTDPNTQKTNIFTIVHHLNIGADLIADSVEKEELAVLNLTAGKKAKAAAAYVQALIYLEAGITYLPDNHWNTHYELALALYNEAIESAFLSGKYERMETLFTGITCHTVTLLDNVHAYEIKIQAYMAQNKLTEALSITIFFVKLLGVKLPKNPGLLHIIINFLKTKWALSHKQPEDLIRLPEMTDPYKQAALNIIAKIGTVTFSVVPNLLPVIVFKGVLLSFRYGNAPISSFYFAAYGLVLCGILGQIDKGFKFGTLALDMSKRYSTKQYRAKTLMVVAHFIRHWKIHSKESFDMLQECYQTSIETGDLENASIAALAYTTHLFQTGMELTALEKQLKHYNDSMKLFRQKTIYFWNEAYRQMVLNLTGMNQNNCRLVGEAFDETKMLPHFYETNDRTGVFQVSSAKLILAVLFEAYELAHDNVEIVRKYIDGTAGTMDVVVMNFFESLTLLQLCNSASWLKKRRFIRRIKQNQKKLKKWSTHAPMNHLHRYQLIHAELAKVDKHHRVAARYYTQAAETANQNGYIQDEAIAHECAAKYYISAERNRMAGVCLQKACHKYREWGAHAKVADLTAKYGPYLKREAYYPE